MIHGWPSDATDGPKVGFVIVGVVAMVAVVTLSTTTTPTLPLNILYGVLRH